MDKHALLDAARTNARSWLVPQVDEDTRREVQRMLDSDEDELTECFYSDLEFGTGGLRGVMGVGTMRMNRYTVGIATQGLADYILGHSQGGHASVAIAYDSRNNSPEFARTAAAVLSANGIKVLLFPALRPTPLLSYTVRERGCTAGLVITASHNPPEYNGYKVYWEDGGQIVAPHDEGIIARVRSVRGVSAVRMDERPELIELLDETVENAYLERVAGIVRSPGHIAVSGLHVMYTPIHGTGITLVPAALRKAGFGRISIVSAQEVPDGNFPTVASPNPEEEAALALALEQADKEGADIVLGTDPDADRVGIAVRNDEGKMVLINGNQAGSLLAWYELSRLKESGLLHHNHFVARTVVTSPLVSEIASHFGIACYQTLTGFKFIADVIRKKEGKEVFVCGGEESYGYLVGDFVRDKDAVVSSVALCEIAAWAKANGSSLWGELMELYAHFGLYHEKLLSFTMKGLDGLKQIREMMTRLREKPPVALGGSAVVRIHDYKNRSVRDLRTGETTPIDLPVSNVLQFELADGSRITGRPSGTEPKIKFYFSMREAFLGRTSYAEQVSMIERRMDTVRLELGL